MPYTEEKELTLRFELQCEFPDDYQGEADGYVWMGDFSPIASEILQSIVSVVARHPGWSLRPKNRGRASEDEVTFLLRKAP